jgi:hypothetical protein
LTCNNEHDYKFYIGIDGDDPIYDNNESLAYLKQFTSLFKNISIEFIYMDGIPKGHLTVMWNRLFERSYSDGYDYFFQCGDDISFETKGWANDCIHALENNSGIGMTGPLNNNARILTQSFVSRKHMELFGYYFPVEIINWCCDDWINEVYIKLNCFFPLKNHRCLNVGGNPRYEINNDPNFIKNIKTEGSFLKLKTYSSELAQRDFKRATENAILKEQLKN